MMISYGFTSPCLSIEIDIVKGKHIGRQQTWREKKKEMEMNEYPTGKQNRLGKIEKNRECQQLIVIK